MSKTFYIDAEIKDNPLVDSLVPDGTKLSPAKTKKDSDLLTHNDIPIDCAPEKTNVSAEDLIPHIDQEATTNSAKKKSSTSSQYVLKVLDDTPNPVQKDNKEPNLTGDQSKEIIHSSNNHTETEEEFYEEADVTIVEQAKEFSKSDDQLIEEELAKREALKKKKKKNKKKGKSSGVFSKDAAYAVLAKDLSKKLIKNDHVIRIDGRVHLYFKTTRAFKSLFNKNGNKVIRDYYEEKNFAPDNKIIPEILANLDASSAIPQVNPYDNTRAKRYINFRNGVLDLKTMKRVEKGFKKMQFLRQIPVDYPFDYNAECPVFLKFLHTTFEGDLEKINLVRKVFALIISDVRINTKQAIILIGRSDSGKSVLGQTLFDIVGKESATALRPDQFDQNFLTMNLVDRYLNYAAEISPEIIKTTVFRQSTGGDPILADVKNDGSVVFRNRAIHVIGCKRLPNFDAADDIESLLNRFVFITFNNVIPKKEQDPELQFKINEEGPGIVQWALGAFPDLIKEKFILNSCQSFNNDKKAELLRYQFPVDAFIKEHIVESPGNLIAKDEVKDAYKKYCCYHEIEPISKKSWLPEIKHYYPKTLETHQRIPYKGHENCRTFQGIAIDYKDINKEEETSLAEIIF